METVSACQIPVAMASCYRIPTDRAVFVAILAFGSSFVVSADAGTAAGLACGSLPAMLADTATAAGLALRSSSAMGHTHLLPS